MQSAHNGLQAPGAGLHLPSLLSPPTRFFPALLLPEVVFSTCVLCLPQDLCTCSPFCPECASPSYSLGPLPRLLYLGHLRREAIPDPLLSVPSHHFIILYKPFTYFPIYVLAC